MGSHSKSKIKILISGGTGFLGQKVVPLLREHFDVYVISRSGKTEVQGDLCQWNGAMNIEKLKNEKFDIFLHMAGLYDLAASHVDAFQNNISATGNALKVANQLGIPVFINTSSIAAGINSALPMVKPYDLNFSRPFPDAYAESKALGEKVILNWNGEFRLKVNLRLGILVGDTKKGEIQRIDGPYHAPFAFQRLKALIEMFPTSLPVPGLNEKRFPLLPVDIAAAAICQFCEWSMKTTEVGYKSFHLTPNEGLDVRELYISTLKNLFIRSKGVSMVNRIPKWLLNSFSEMALKLPKEEINYLLLFPQYDSTDTQKVLGKSWCPEFKDYERAFWSGYEKYVSNSRN